jgi:hypothetical protein
MLETNLSGELAPEDRDRRRGEIRTRILERSPYIREPHFSRIHTTDVALAFEAYDTAFFRASIKSALGETPLRFRLATRATKRGGSLARFRSATAGASSVRESYELTVSTTLLFDSFRDGHRTVTIAGHPCPDRLDALQRVLEHEIVHLCEHLVWHDSDCARRRFQAIARGVFGHTEHTHALVTSHERAADLGFRPGQTVTFEFEGVRYEGILNRVTKRATVLVPDPAGRLATDGRRYRWFYVPLQLLRKD